MDKQPLQPIRVIIAGGGTGGHVFPAIAIAQAIKDQSSNARILFVGAKDRLEMTKVPQSGFEIIGLHIAGIQRRLTLKNLKLPFLLIRSMIKAAKIIKHFCPDVVIGVGGYASGPVVRAAARKGIPTLIQEQNSYPGLTNRILARKADKICVAYEGMERFFPKEKIYLTGNPVRKDVIELEGKKEEALAYFGLSNKKPVVLVTGGSLGARTINESISKSLSTIMYEDIQLIWQTGVSYYHQAKEETRGMEKFGICVKDFIDRMDFAYAAADIVVSRAGAIAVSEICVVGKPAILIPSPNVAEDHQTSNARTLENRQAAIMLSDTEARDKLGKTILGLIRDEKMQQRMKVQMAGMSFHQAAAVIAGIAIGMKKHQSEK